MVEIHGFHQALSLAPLGLSARPQRRLVRGFLLHLGGGG